MAHKLQALASMAYEDLQKIAESDGKIDPSQWFQNTCVFHGLHEEIKNILLMQEYNWSGSIESVLSEYIDAEFLEEHWKARRIQSIERKLARKHQQQKFGAQIERAIANVIFSVVERERA